MKNAGLKKKVLFSLLAAGVFGLGYTGDAYAASINGKVVGTDITDKVILTDAGTAKMIIGQGDVNIKTNANLNVMAQKFKDGLVAFKGDKMQALMYALNPSGQPGDVPLMGVVGGECMMDKEFIDALRFAKSIGGFIGLTPGQQAAIDKIVNINTVKHPDGPQTVTFDKGVNITIGDAQSSPVIMGVVGGDMLANTSFIYGIGSGKPTDATSKIDITRNGDVNLKVNNGNVIGAVGGSAAIGVGNIKANFKIPLFKQLNAQFSGKEASTTINGNVKTTISGGSNVAGLANGGAAMALGGTATSTVTGGSNIFIDSKVDVTNSKDGVTAGITGGGMAMSTFGGTANSNVNGAVDITINNGLTGFVAGGGVAAAVDSTGVAEKLLHDGQQYGNNHGFVDITDVQLEKLMGMNGGIPQGTITIDNAISGGTANATTGDTNIKLNGTTTVAGVVGGGIAVSSHTYTVKPDAVDYPVTGYKEGDAYGKSVANAETGKSVITVNLDSSKLDKGKLAGAVAGLKNAAGLLMKGQEFNALKAGVDALKLAENQGAAVGVMGGGIAIAHGSDGNLTNGQGATSTANNAGAEININKGYAVGVFGAGMAAAMNNANAAANTKGDVVINIAAGSEAVGVGGNGIAYYTGSSNGGTKSLTGTAAVTAKNTTINLSGKADGVMGGGFAIDDSQADTTNASVKTEGVSTINVKAGSEINKLNFAPIIGMTGAAPQQGIDMGSYAAAAKAAGESVAIAGGGAAIGGGAESLVNESVINVDGGTVNGDIIAGGVAVYGYGDKGGAAVKTSTINLNSGKVDGNVYAGGSASSITTGSAGYDQAKAMVEDSTINLNGAEVTGFVSGKGISGSANDVAKTSTLNVNGNNTLAALADGGSKIKGFSQINVAADSTTTITGLTAGNQTAFIDAEGGKITVNAGAKLDISQLTKTTDKYFIADNYAQGSRLWNDDELAYDRTQGFATTEEVNGDYKVTYKNLDQLNKEEQQQAGDSMAGALGQYGNNARGIIDGYIKDSKNTNTGAKDLLADWTKSTGDVSADMRAALLFGEAAGVTSNSLSMAGDFADNAILRLSFTQDKVNGEDRVAEDGGVWAKYINGKHEVDGLGSSFGDLSSSNDYSGVMVGAELAKKGDYQYGIAFSYGDGDGSGMGVENDFDTWSVNLYSNMKKNDINFIADLGYSSTGNELTAKLANGTLTADRDVNILSAGVRAEKLYTNGNTQVVPYIGLRYFSVDGDAYTSYYNGKAAFENDVDRQSVWTLPLGVSLRNETVTNSGWRFTPKVDVAYIFAFGDTDSSVTVNSGSGMDTLTYDVIDSNSWLGSVALEAGRDDWSYGVGYSYQKGSSVENNKWFVNVNYSF